MALDFIGSLSKANQQFKNILQDRLQDVLKGYFEIVEGVTVEDVAKKLDTLAGIDAWHINKIRGIRGVALRIQTTTKSWDTFTIRKARDSGAKTEYEKRKEAIKNNYLYPYLTVQAYISNNDILLGYAVARTIDIIEMIDNGFCYAKHTGKNQIGQASFFVVKWEEMKNKGYEIIINKQEQS